MADPAIEPFMAADALAHPRRRLSASTTADQGRPKTSLPETNNLDPDTCRICRGEATPDEPLFYPCKCSGSIKYVHQECLMEWLSHSQKKHCELCKTPFRFTKLYSPKMPNTLPVHVFIGHVAKYLFRNILTWLRAGLVAVVWLCWLPWLMRSVWSFLFWLSDEGLGGGQFWIPANISASHPGHPYIGLKYLDACPLNKSAYKSAMSPNLGRNMNGLLQTHSTAPFSGSWHGFDITTDDSLTAGLLRLFFGSMPPSSTVSHSIPGAATSLDPHASLLSNVSFLRNFSRYPVLNRTLINIFEGQIITILVIICFILVILVRDYVVQQQPEINMRAAFAANEQEQHQHQHQHENDEEQRMAAQVENLPGPDDDWVDQDDDGSAAEWQNQVLDLPFGNIGPRWEQDNSQAEGSNGPFAQPQPQSSAEEQAEVSELVTDTLANLAPSPAQNSDIMDTEQPQSPVATVHEYLRIYRQSNGDPHLILQAIQDEGLEDKLGYWARVTRSMIDKTNGNPPQQPSTEEGQQSRGHRWADGPSGEELPIVQLPLPSTPEFAWHGGMTSANDDFSEAKGKEKEDEVPEESQASPIASGSSSSWNNALRPRSVSDGPQRAATVNPLANNSWSFSALPAEAPARGNASPQELPQVTEQPDDAWERTGAPRTPTPVDWTWTPAAGEEIEELEAQIDASNLDDVSTAASASGSAHAAFEHLELDQASLDINPDGADIREQEPGVANAGDVAVPQRPPLQRGVMDRLADFMWDGIEARELDIGAGHADILDADHVHDNAGDDELFEEAIPLEGDNPDDFQRDPEVVEAAVAAGLDPEAMDDAEDIEGVLELIGMRGPLVGLFQNAVFCAVLVSVTIFICVFIPYNIGRVSVWAAMNPMRLVRMLFSFTKFIQDLAVAIVAGFCSLLLGAMFVVGNALGLWLPSARRSCENLMAHTWNLSDHAGKRILESLSGELPLISATEMQNFSAISHEALQTLKSQVAALFVGVGAALDVVFDGKLPSKALHFIVWAGQVGVSALDLMRDLPHILLNPASWVISFDVPDVPVGVDPALASWSGPDRFWAILCGYLSMSGVGALYLRRGTPFSNGQIAQEWEASLIDLLNQASGVMKVILIISIEMLAFPLYCGLLLDAALLPLFEDASLKSRMAFTINYPLTSIFVHWFVGTGYMFHFALFVSMCRKIMRKGVLYFIRDPDDPDFHPVRDVLERNVVTQLRKILFSAFVYGALVIVCLGGVVWGLSFTVPNVLPIHYSSNEPVLEFPIDLLFYNFAMPLAVKFFKPSDGLHAMYTWWLRKCARGLRLTWFLFGERRIDEEGTLVLRSSSRYSSLPWWKRFFLEVNQKSQVVPKRWKNTFKGGTAKPSLALSKEKFTSSSLRKRRLVESGQLIKDGVFVRTPGSDQVKIPKGDKVFMEVSEDDERMDGKPDLPDTDLYSSDQYQLVYLPPHFKARIFLFILFIWVFAAVTGVGFTIVPLVFGRKMFEILIPAHIRTNDIYAFSIGIYILGSAAYLAFHLHSIIGKVRSWSATALRTVFASEAPARLARLVARASKLVYTYTTLLVVFPLMLTSLMELYLIIPLHTYVNPPSPYALPLENTGTLAAGVAAPNQHTARVIQSWTLGLLYVKLGARIMTSLYEGHRPAHAVRAVLRRGWLDPDAGVLTRAFVIPGLFVGGLALFGPAYGASLLEARGMLGSPSPAPHELKMVYRLAYPAAAFSALAAVLLWSVLGVFHSWKVRIRDEAYLIGERLHNFGIGTVGATAGRAQWRGARM
ncbi:hypothetical protein BN1723_000875 [Verticillium longisporum]|uniref:RING-type E3 ubiquitin transferase n=1 Tax=Verticillium longisporum TaxID=100787 RepID=A0A0G4NCU5_VERLO|nr:hypothetical protein BN1708_010164 [Verticillium longisporum]CRK44189.1 hypothetical protein BN1723_000875 [Verticillium longisporum]